MDNGIPCVRCPDSSTKVVSRSPIFILVSSTLVKQFEDIGYAFEMGADLFLHYNFSCGLSACVTTYLNLEETSWAFIP